VVAEVRNADDLLDIIERKLGVAVDGESVVDAVVLPNAADGTARSCAPMPRC